MKYAREAATRTSFDSIFLMDDNKPEKKVKTFYKKVSPWYERSKLDELEKQIQNNGEDIYNVIYMLYNKEDNSIYVGKADRLITRLKQHENNPLLSEPMPVFTHFRYSIITEGYEDYIYIIENSAIHDLACIFNMPKAKTYRYPLSKICNGIHIQEIKMNNNAEAQRKIIK